MKRILSILLPAILSTYLPMCAVVSLPGSLVDKYIPQDLREGFQYSSQLFGVLWKAYGNDEAAQPAQAPQMALEPQLIVSNQPPANESDCPLAKSHEVEMIAGPDVSVTVEAPLEMVSFEVPKLLEINEKKFEADLRGLVIEQMKLYEQNLSKKDLLDRRTEIRHAIRDVQKNFRKASVFCTYNARTSGKALRFSRS